MVRFCQICGRVMSRDTTTGSVIFQCACGAEQPGAPNDARISGQVLGTSETLEMYRVLLKFAAFDRTNQLVARQCVDCGLDYMTQIRVGSAEVVIYKCKCGREETNGAEAPPAAEPRAAPPRPDVS